MRQRSISSSSLIPRQGIVYRISCNIKKEGNNVISMRGKKKSGVSSSGRRFSPSRKSYTRGDNDFRGDDASRRSIEKERENLAKQNDAKEAGTRL